MQTVHYLRFRAYLHSNNFAIWNGFLGAIQKSQHFPHTLSGGGV